MSFTACCCVSYSELKKTKVNDCLLMLTCEFNYNHFNNNAVVCVFIFASSCGFVWICSIFLFVLSVLFDTVQALLWMPCAFFWFYC